MTDEQQQELIPKPRPDILTVKFQILDRNKIQWLWDLMVGLGKPEPGKTENDLGVRMWASSWGDTMSEKEYILERVARFLDRWDRQELLEELGKDETWDEISQLEELFDEWEKEARKIFGADATQESISAYYKKQKADREARKLADANRAGSENSTP